MSAASPAVIGSSSVAPKLIVFDCDGTLIDSQHAIVAAMGLAFEQSNLPIVSREKILAIVGLSLYEAVHTLLPDEAPARIAAIAERYKLAFHHVRVKDTHSEPMYDGARDLVHSLAARGDVQLGIATGKSRRGVAAFLERERLEGVFHTVQTADTSPSKPNPDMIHRAMAATGADANGTVMIGDTTFDMLMARNAGVGGVAVTWGYHLAEDLAETGPRHQVDDMAGLGDVLAQFLSAGAR